ncbi:hypothetical protein M422DRAFT_50329 [Sphaerobolus stellatus SS14]|uniref:Uncharacterized protein n=1 Tax=Sphaerobolus stellatus (strain SS14) TaxID=990650 RepID=A0A0C9VIW9_SPHS4|nr:hypothetical protein M422DRAFT_50329 [Sphaerobolus stellatus SS14]
MYYRATLADNSNEEFIIQDTWLDLGDWRSRFPQEDLHAVIENFTRMAALTAFITTGEKLGQSRTMFQIWFIVGYLVDFNKSIELWRDSSSTENRAKHSYTSINDIKNRKPSPLGDIESIYYILCFITTSHNGPISAKYAVDTIPTLIKGWMSKMRILVLDTTLNHFRQPRTMQIQLYYKDLHPLVNELYHILKKRYDKAYRNMGFSIEEQLDAVQACFDRVLTPTSEIASNIGDEGGDHDGGEKRDTLTKDDKSAASERKRRRLNEQGEYEITEEVAKKR